VSRLAAAVRRILAESDPDRLTEVAAAAAIAALGADRARVERVGAAPFVGRRAAVDPSALGFAAGEPVDALVVPVGGGGWIAAADKPGGFTDDDEGAARALADCVAVALAAAAAARVAQRTASLIRTLIEQLPAVTYYRPLDTPGLPSFVSPQVEAMTGFRPEDFLADPELFHKRIHPDDRERVRAEQAAFDPADTREPIRGEYRLVRKDGRVIWVENYALAVRDADEARFVMGLIFDVSERKRIEEELRQALKLQAVGKLAGGVAHDFNNMLSVILSYASSLAAQLPIHDARREDLDEIIKAGERARDLTRRLLAFSRRQVLRPRVLDLNAVVHGMLGMLRPMMREDVALVTALAPDLRPVRADPGQIEQVLINLAANARDAMPSGGRMTIATANLDVDAAFARGRPGLAVGAHVLLSVTDEGVGMDEGVRARIFEPFFTTKEAGQGTGLGLSTVLGIVEQSGGTVWVDSAPGCGATFRICLPATDEAPAAAHAPAKAEPNAGSETVLLCEDDAQVARLVRSILERQGYRVLQAHSGEDALALARAHGGTIHALVTDVIMPGTSGRELAERLKETRPDVKVLFISGYTDDAIVRHGLVAVGAAVLLKPFTDVEIGSRLRALIDQSP
jgi:PAS domain S-box-containing protein